MEYGLPACRAVIETYTAPVSTTGYTYGIIRAGAHDATLTATDGATPPSSATSAITITGLPPDAVETDCAGAIATMFGGGSYQEVIFIKVTAQGEDMGPQYSAEIAQVQESVDHKIIDPTTGMWGQWRTMHAPWVPPRQPSYQSFGTFFYRPDDSEIVDTKGVGVSASMRTYLAAQPAGTPFYQQRQRVRLRYQKDCDFTDFDSSEFYVTAVSTGNPDQPGFGGSIDFIDGRHDTTVMPYPPQP